MWTMGVTGAMATITTGATSLTSSLDRSHREGLAWATLAHAGHPLILRSHKHGRPRGCGNNSHAPVFRSQ